ncbi:hypothetical protein BD410DRAFT_227200 [Rickenella mellea]|uniref:Zn(2)-C6 fungal-type domain-containing protein n=1 Tax=Rickenella mellea TaxID=50990 RepID=A0A4Y7QNR6_9AGAM|nr:hypothetical protein BD410DRAFT_227200 [Rickenella mellea]
MPKVPTEASNLAKASPSGLNAHVLKRNQACHQCRRRKLKCDANRPCSTCVRSHRNAVNHAPNPAEVPQLECTFDEVPEEAVPTPTKMARTRMEKMESRISELESLLQQERANNTKSRSHSTATFNTSRLEGQWEALSPAEAVPEIKTSGRTVSDMAIGELENPSENMNISPTTTPARFEFKFGGVMSVTNLESSSPQISSETNSTGKTEFNGSPQSSAVNQLYWPHWPEGLPAPALLHHLVEMFFAFHPHAGLLFHAPTFMASLMLPSSHPNFPLVSILHAICAVGSMYTVAVPQPPRPDFTQIPPDELFNNRHKARMGITDSFGEKQAKLAMLTLNISSSFGERLFECLQANVVVNWFYYSHAKWSELFMSSARALRSLVPLGINMCPPFHSISKVLRTPSIIPPAQTVVEDEMRRNTFWLAYCGERLHSCGHGWASCLDDQDISQLLPVRRDQFEEGTLVPPHQRQWAHTADVLLRHCAEQTDSFILYVKASMLLSKVKTFNLRFRTRNFAGDPDMTVLPGTPDLQEENGQRIDPRATKAFQSIDKLVETFVENFPRGFNDAVVNNLVDTHLFTACVAPHIARIMLHDPHANLKRVRCSSRQRILEAARAVLQHTYSVQSTSFDLTLSDNFIAFAWHMTGRVLVRFLKSAKDENDHTAIKTFRTELEFIRIALANVGERLPLAYRYAKMLDDILLRTVGVSEELDMNMSTVAVPRVLSAPSNLYEGMTYEDGQDGLRFVDVIPPML